MWVRIAHFILKFRSWLILLIAVMTIFMAFQAKDVELSFDFSKVVPASDPDMIYFQQFKDKFGEDGNILAIGIKDSSIYQVQNFTRFKYFSDAVSQVGGVNNVVSLPGLVKLEKDKTKGKRKFNLVPIFEDVPDNQQELDSLLSEAKNQKFYSGQVINEETGATVMLVAINKEVLNSARRQVVVEDILFLGEEFTKSTGIELHYAGLPFVRSVMTGKVREELNMFLILSVAVTALILLFFFRSWQAVLFPMLVIVIMIIWSVGTLGLFDYKITILTGLIPPIIVVIGIPNCVYLLNRYHQEISRHGNKIKALSRIISKIGIVTLITNFTTAIGFLVLAFTDIVILKEFGVVAGINIMATFFISIVIIPVVFSYLPAPNPRQLKHLNFKVIDKVLTAFDLLVHRHKYTVFLVTGGVLVVGIIGIFRIEAVSYMVDDIPENSKVKQDLLFFERNFGGVMPLELVIDTGKKKGILDIKKMQKVDELSSYLEEQKYISQPVSVVSFVKAARQAYYNNNPSFYSLPGQDKGIILLYLKDQSDKSGLLNSFVDSTGQVMRVSLKVADVGSNRMDSLVQKVIQPKIEEIFADSGMDVIVTGTTLLFIKGNKFLIQNLQTSMLLAFVLIALIMALLFRNYKMIIISLIPNVIPLVITAGLMGYFGVPLKPSTALIFSIAFGISIDDSIHYLAKYRQELLANNFFVPFAVSKSLKETGASMVYTSVILFAGFIIFAGSNFGGTIALGILTSTTLLMAMFTNLIVLPALLLAFDDGRRSRDSHPLIEHYDEFYDESEDEEIDLSKLGLEGLLEDVEPGNLEETIDNNNNIKTQ